MFEDMIDEWEDAGVFGTREKSCAAPQLDAVMDCCWAGRIRIGFSSGGLKMLIDASRGLVSLII